MESILVLIHTGEDSALIKPSLESIAAGVELASRLKAPLAIAVFGLHANHAASALASTGARLLAVDSAPFAQPRYATDAAACEALCRASAATIVLAPASSRIARVAAGVSHRLGGVIDTHITGLSASPSLQATR